MKLRLPRGLRDLDPDEYRRIRYVSGKFQEVAEKYQFPLMEPSTIEFLGTLELKAGSDIENEIYAFTDKGGRRLALRFDLTVGLTRYVVSNPQLPKPIKLASCSVMWRYDEPQFARYRNFYQWDAEIFGADPVSAGGEIIAFSEDLLRELGLREIRTRVSSRKVLESAISERIRQLDPVEVMRIVDKKERQGIDVVRELLSGRGLTEDDVKWLSDLVSIEDRPTRARERLARVDSELVESPDYAQLAQTVEVAQSFGAQNVSIDLSVVRGIDYYDGVVFETSSAKAPQVGSLLGGGSFTVLVEALGGNFTAWGAAGGIERTLLALEATGQLGEKEVKRGTYVAYTEADLAPVASAVTKKLRDFGIASETSLVGRSLSNQLSYAERIGYRNVVIVGRKEWSNRRVVCKDFESGVQKEIPYQDLPRFLRGD